MAWHESRFAYRDMDQLLQDLRYALRMVTKSPGLTAIALVTIGIATGANATVFGFVSALLLRPAPGVADPGSLIAIYTSDYSSGPYGDSSYPDYLSMKAELPAFATLAAQQNSSAGVVQVGDSVERVGVSAVTSEFFELLGVTPAVGRLFAAEDLLPSSPPAVVIGDGCGVERSQAIPQPSVGHSLSTGARTPSSGFCRKGSTASTSAVRPRSGYLSWRRRPRRETVRIAGCPSSAAFARARRFARRRLRLTRSPDGSRRRFPNRTSAHCRRPRCPGRCSR